MEVDLEVDYWYVSNLFNFWNMFTYVSNVENISSPITSPRSIVREIKGAHKQNKSNNDVKCIYFKNKTVRYIPRDIGKFFPNLKTLQITQCNLKEISRDDFQWLESLEELFLSENQLKSLPDDLFINMPNLKQIDFSLNQLEYMSSKLLTSLFASGVKFIDFRQNTKIDEFYEASSKGRVKSVEDLGRIIDEKCLKPGTFFLQSEEKLFSHHQEKLCEGIEDLWKSGKFSDFKMIVKSKEFQVHKSVLSICSLVFAEMFEEDKNAKEMKIEDLSADAVEELLCFMYTGKYSKETKKSFELFALASKLNVPEMKLISEEIILDSLIESNAYKIFMLGHRYSSES